MPSSHRHFVPEKLVWQVSARLKQLPGVVVIPRDDALKKRHAESRIWNETWLAAFFHKPCNHELFVLQSLNMEGALPPCRLEHVLEAYRLHAQLGFVRHVSG